MAKAATTRKFVDVEIKVTRRQDKKDLLRQALSIWKERWSNSDKGRVTYELFHRVALSRLQGDFYVNQVFSGHGAFDGHQARFFHSSPQCFCGTSESSIRHCLYECAIWKHTRDKFFPRNFLFGDLRLMRSLSRRDLCLDGYCRKEVRIIEMIYS